MRARTLALSLLYVATAVLTVALPGPVASAATGSITATPNTDLSSGDPVTITGSGFSASVQIAVCQGIVAGTLGIEDCGGPASFFMTDENGSFSAQLAARRFLTVAGQPVDCANTTETCSFGAAEYNDIPNTAVATPVSFKAASGHPQPDLIFKRRDTQQLFEDNQYFANVSAAPQRAHSLLNGEWTFALLVQNDGDVTDNLVLQTPVIPPAPFTLKVFVGYYNVTAYAAGTGLVFRNVAPGQSFLVAVQLSAPPELRDSGVLASVKLSSGLAPEQVDFARLWVSAPSSG
jgi:hypothetical protein